MMLMIVLMEQYLLRNHQAPMPQPPFGMQRFLSTVLRFNLRFLKSSVDLVISRNCFFGLWSLYYCTWYSICRKCMTVYFSIDVVSKLNHLLSHDISA
jgi:hypothetical protein